MAPKVLDRTRALIEPAMRAAVESLDDNMRPLVTYHLGWTDETGNAVDAATGKGIRSALAVLGAEAVEGEASEALPGAVAVELIHNFSLIHDDIMDNDRMRRHRRTVWDVFGVGDAIIVGDALHALAFRVLLEAVGDERRIQATERLVRATTAMIAGQAQDVALDRRDHATLAECMAMEADKTGALLAQSVAIGAVLGGGPDPAVDALATYGASLGVAFQAVDDVLGIWGDPEVTGKPAGNDLREQKKSIPIALAFEQGGSIADAVKQAFARGVNEADVVQLADALEQAGLRGRVEQIARTHLDEALVALDSADIDTAAHCELTELAAYVADRRT